jgi:LysR family cyn operon transcriptional activator
VGAFSRDHPGVAVEVRELRAGPIEEQLRSGELDLGIALHPASHDEIEAEPLFEERLLLAVAPSHPLAPRRSLAVKALAGVPLALLPRSFATRGLVDAALKAAGVQPTVRIEMATVESLLGVCRHGDVASIVPERALRLAPDLRGIALTAPPLLRQAGLLWRRGASRSAAATEFAARLRRSLGR